MSKVETMRAKDKKKGSLVPRLRFPEFVGTGEWEETFAGKLLTESSQIGSKGDTAKKLTVKLWGKGVFGKEETIKGSSNTQYYRRKAGQFIYSKLDFLNQAFGIIPEHLDGFESTVDLPCFDLCSTVAPIFFLEYVKREDFYKKFGEIADGGRKAKRIQVDTFLSFPILLPSHPKEQQRIADCLSSLDERITAEANKLNALKAHKSGLLKQLFPAEGETLPALRFPEFRDAGEWEEKKLGDICEKIMDGTHFSPKSKCGPFLYLTSKNIQNGALDLSNTSNISEEEHRQIFAKCPVKIKDILLTKDGANTGNCALNSLSVEFSLLSSVAVLRGKQTSIVQEFLYHTIGSPFIQKIIQESISGQAITRITLEKVGSYRIFLPIKPEQQRIADCLSSLNELITAQTQKIDLLKTHKKGLMQQLFPVIDEAKA